MMDECSALTADRPIIYTSSSLSLCMSPQTSPERRSPLRPMQQESATLTPIPCGLPKPASAAQAGVIDEIQAQVEALQEEAAAARAEAEKLLTDRAEWEQRAVAAEAKLQLADTEVEQLRRTTGEAEAAAEAWGKRFSEMLEEHNALQARLETATSQAAGFDKALALLKADKSTMAQALAAAEATVAQQTAELEDLNEHSRAATGSAAATNRQLAAEVRELKAGLAAAAGQIAAKSGENTRLTGEVDALKEQVQALTAAVAQLSDSPLSVMTAVDRNDRNKETKGGGWGTSLTPVVQQQRFFAAPAAAVAMVQQQQQQRRETAGSIANSGQREATPLMSPMAPLPVQHHHQQQQQQQRFDALPMQQTVAAARPAALQTPSAVESGMKEDSGRRRRSTEATMPPFDTEAALAQRQRVITIAAPAAAASPAPHAAAQPVAAPYMYKPTESHFDSAKAMMARAAELEERLLTLNMERSELEKEQSKFPGSTAGRTGAERRRRVEVEERLGELVKDISGVRLQLKKLGCR